jgi:hypothetical protein
LAVAGVEGLWLLALSDLQRLPEHQFERVRAVAARQLRGGECRVGRGCARSGLCRAGFEGTLGG